MSAAVALDRYAPATAVWRTEEPWARQPCDTDTMWPLFCAFLRAGPARSISSYCRTLGKTGDAVALIASECYWTERARKFDEHAHEQFLQTMQLQMLEQARESIDRTSETLDLAAQVCLREMSKLWEQSQQSAHLVLKPEAVMRMTESTVKLIQLTSGQATERVDIREVDEALRALTPDETMTLVGLKRKVAPER